MATRSAQPITVEQRRMVLPLLQLGLLLVLTWACVRVAMPFVGLLLWSMILAVMLYPLHLKLVPRLSNKWSATLIGVVGALLILAPTVIVAASLVTSLSSLVSGLQHNTLVVPPPPAKLADVPIIGARITEAWAAVSANAPAALKQYGPTMKGPIAWMASTAGKLAAANLLFVLAFVIAAILVAYGPGVINFAKRLLEVVTGSATRGAYLVSLTSQTIRGVALGIVGVAAIQAALLGVGFFMIGIPGAGLLAVAVLLLGVVQVPATLLTIPAIAYVFATKPITPAIIFAVWSLVAGLSDNALKPLLLGRGMDVPMPVILIGVLGGMVADGLLGLFVGPVLLAIGWVLFMEWLRNQPHDPSSKATSPP